MPYKNDIGGAANCGFVRLVLGYPASKLVDSSKFCSVVQARPSASWCSGGEGKFHGVEVGIDGEQPATLNPFARSS